MFADTEPCDRYDDAARMDAEREAALDAVLAEYDAARADLRRIFTGMDPIARWAILERYAAAALAVDTEKDRANYGAMNATIVAEINAERVA